MRPRAPSSAATRRLLATIAMLLWIAGFEIGPGLHVGLHAAWGHHHHEAAQPGHAHEHAHDHDHDHDHDHEVARAHGSSERSAHGVEEIDPEHGRHGAAHRGVAVLLAPWPSTWIASAPVDGRLAPPFACESPGLRVPVRARARGPPARG